MRPGVLIACESLACIVAALASAAGSTGGIPGHDCKSRYFVTSDGVRLHYLEAGPQLGHTIVFVPGWTMPAWIWRPQIQAFARRYHVVAFDPRGQGDSDAPAVGLRAGAARPGHRRADRQPGTGAGAAGGLVARRARHARLCAHAWRRACWPGWCWWTIRSARSRRRRLMPPRRARARTAARHRACTASCAACSATRQSAAYLDRLTEATLRTPEPASRALLAYPVPRTYWREAVYSTDQAGALRRAARLAGGAGGEPRAQPPGHRRSRCSPTPATRCSSMTRRASTRCWQASSRRTVWP